MCGRIGSGICLEEGSPRGGRHRLCAPIHPAGGSELPLHVPRRPGSTTRNPQWLLRRQPDRRRYLRLRSPLGSPVVQASDHRDHYLHLRDAAECPLHTFDVPARRGGLRARDDYQLRPTVCIPPASPQRRSCRGDHSVGVPVVQQFLGGCCLYLPSNCVRIHHRSRQRWHLPSGLPDSRNRTASPTAGQCVRFYNLRRYSPHCLHHPLLPVVRVGF